MTPTPIALRTIRQLFIGVVTALCATQAIAENWVTVLNEEEDGDRYFASVDKDSIHSGSDGLVYFTAHDEGRSDLAVDCQRRIIYLLKFDSKDYPNWREEGSITMGPNSVTGTELQYACANAR